jgi:hypothetical protein
MAVTVTTNTVSAPWTPAQLLAGIKQAFVDSGEITDWRDTYTGGSRTMGILRKTYNAGTYGSTDYGISVFKRATSNPYDYQMFITAFREWDIGTNAPLGTSGRDFPEDWQLNATAQDYGDMPLNGTERGNLSYASNGKFNFNTNAAVTFTCLKSGDPSRTNFRWYIVQQGNRFSNFQIASEDCVYSDPEQQGLGLFYSLVTESTANARTYASCGGVSFGFDRSFPGGMIRGQDQNCSFTDNQYMTHGQALYVIPSGPQTNISANGINSFLECQQVRLPVTGNWGYDILPVENPIIMAGPYSWFHEKVTFPVDFGVACVRHLSENSGQLDPLDKLTTDGGEEYIVISAQQPTIQSSTGNFTNGLAFVARSN